MQLPARADSKAYAYPARTNSDSDARTAVVISTVIIAAAFNVALAWRVAVRILDDHAASATFPPAASVFVTDHAYVFEAVVEGNREAAGESGAADAAVTNDAPAPSASRMITFFILNSSELRAGVLTAWIAECSRPNVRSGWFDARE